MRFSNGQARHARLAAMVVVAVGGIVPAEPCEANDLPRRTSFEFRSAGGAPLSGRFHITVEDHPESPKTQYLMKFSGVAAFGLASAEVLWSVVAKDRLALQFAAVAPFEGADPSKWTSQMKLEPCRSVMAGAKRQCFVYREARSPEIQTEFFTPYEGIDLLTSLLQAARMAVKGEREATFNFVERTTTTQVRLVAGERATMATALGTLDSVAVSVRPLEADDELYRVVVALSPKGPFVTRLEFRGKDGDLVATAQKPVW